MRRIPRPSRAIDPSAALQLSVRQCVTPSPCRSAVIACAQSRTSTAAFSTTSPQAFLLGGKQDKKKHQQFVRRWQKRLLGDSEPIGAHVDPYDPTSPVRIAPEEQGEYEEVLDDQSREDVGEFKYLPAEELGAEKPGSHLMRVGGREWRKQKMERDLAKEFEKLTGRTYTPLSLDMANQIEDLTGTPYTLRDENLLMAQAVHEVTGRPYTRYDFGLHPKLSKPKDIYSRFTQAVAEVYTLKEAGLELDLAKAPNRGVYDRPSWIKDIKFRRTESGELALAFPQYKSAEQFLEIMQRAPEWQYTESAEGEELLVEEGSELLEPVLAQEPAPSMDPATPAFKREAVVKLDPEKKPFDFMSNRPVPRAAPVQPAKPETIVQETVTVQEPIMKSPAPARSSLNELTSSVEASRSTISELRHSILQHRAERLASDFAALKQSVSPSEAISPEEAKWRRVSVTEPALKFALFKRLYQLTGIRISDPHLTSATTLGDIYGHLCTAAKPQPTSLFSTIHVEGQKARERAKQQASNRRKADLGDLITLGNVELRRVKPKPTELRTKTGLNKVIDYAIWERGLKDPPQQQQRAAPTQNMLGLPIDLRGLREGTRVVPEFGRPLPSKGAVYLAKETKKQLDEINDKLGNEQGQEVNRMTQAEKKQEWLQANWERIQERKARAAAKREQASLL